MFASLLKTGFVVFFTAVVATVVILSVPFDRGGRLYHALARFYSRGVLRVCRVRLEVNGLSHLDRSRSHIYVSNHASLFDIPAIIAGIPDQIRLVYKKELERIPLFGWSLKFGRTYIAIDRGKGPDALRSLERAAEKMHTGASVLLFAEGTRTGDGGLQQFKRGAFNLAVQAGIPVVPVTINGSYKILPKGSMRIRPGTITIIIDQPIPTPKANGKSGELQLRDEVRNIIEHHFIRP